MKRLTLTSLALSLLAGCVSDNSGTSVTLGPATTKHYLVTSAPSFCAQGAGVLGEIPVSCLKTASENDFLVEVGPGKACHSSGSFKFEWGTSYRVTVKEQTRNGASPGDCVILRTIESVEGATPDPIGTRYVNSVGSTWGGLYLKRKAAGSPWYELVGYTKPIYCADSLCGSIEDGATIHLGALFVKYPDFVLTEIDGKREIALEPHRN